MPTQIAALLPAGTYYLVLSGCGAGGESSIRFQHLPANTVQNGSVGLTYTFAEGQRTATTTNS